LHSIALYPFLLAVYPVLALFAENSEEVTIAESVLPLFVALSVSIIVFLIFLIVLKKRVYQAALVTAVFMLIVFFYGHAFEYLERKDIYFPQFRHLQIIPVLLVCFFYIVCFLRRFKETSLKKLNSFLNLTLLALVLYNGSLILISRISTSPSDRKADTASEDLRVQNLQDIPTARKDIPDVYYIVLDEFASFNTARQEYGYDNQVLKDYFARKGFQVTSESRSRYICTWKSLDTVLNMEYAPDDRTPLENYARILDSKVSGKFQEMGYSYIYNSDQKLYNGTYENPDADLDLVELKKSIQTSIQAGGIGFSNFSDMLLRTTILRPYYLYLYSLRYGHRYNEQLKLETFNIALDNPSPKYVFSHHLISHEPFVFDEEGGYVPYRSQYDWSDRRWYLGAYKYQTTVLIEMLDKIFSRYESDTLPIIIVQSDHGIRRGVFGPKGDKAKKAQLKEEVETADSAKEILGAYFFPPQLSVPQLAQDFPPVDTFKLVFGAMNDEALSDSNFRNSMDEGLKHVR
jgi:hypothetical protein